MRVIDACVNFRDQRPAPHMSNIGVPAPSRTKLGSYRRTIGQYGYGRGAALAERADIDSLIGRLITAWPTICNIEPDYPGKDPRWPMPIAGQITAII